ncbi:MAG TPA: hypothetical protein VFS52_16920 [Steroidobacteraceae bacterium]|jgi:hypothetical protein|nr:hypothetical protein [Steroidobacteraceae bacterium]
MISKAAAPKRPEQVFFDDPAIDRLMGIVMSLASEHYVLRDRVQALEEQLTNARLIDAAALAKAPSPEQEAQYRAAADDFARTLLEPLLGQQQSLGAAGRFSLRRSRT